jgi:hypothetical protein
MHPETAWQAGPGSASRGSVENTLRRLLPLSSFHTARQGQEDTMHPLQVAARFTALVWCLKTKQAIPAEAVRFARENWMAFLPTAHEGLGRLLIGVARSGTGSARRNRQRPSAGMNKAPRQNLAFSQHRPVSLINWWSFHGKASLGHGARHGFSRHWWLN